MPGLFGLFGLGARSLTSLQSAMNAVSHNVANAATPGFHRQRVDLEAELPQITAAGALGTGVRAGTVRRIQDQFLEAALRRELPLLSRYSARAEILSRSELQFGEPSDTGLASQLDDFYDGWNALASSPEDLGARESVVRLGASLADSLRQASDSLADERVSLTGQIMSAVDDANRAIRELDSLNHAIVASTRGGAVAPDLEDRRDSLIETLTHLVGATASIEGNGTATVRLSGRVVVQQAGFDEIVFDPATSDTLRLHGSTLEAQELGGRVGGLAQVRDGDLVDSLRQLDVMAERLASAVNTIHARGRDRRGEPATDFFVFESGRNGVDGAATTLRVNALLEKDASRVAVGSDGSPGDNSIALDLAALRDDQDGASALLRSLVADVGSRTRESQDLADGQAIVVNSYQAQRESVSGVSLDEEAANLLRFQRSYQAAARLVTTVDEMAQSLLAM